MVKAKNVRAAASKVGDYARRAKRKVVGKVKGAGRATVNAAKSAGGAASRGYKTVADMTVSAVKKHPNIAKGSAAVAVTGATVYAVGKVRARSKAKADAAKAEQ